MEKVQGWNIQLVNKDIRVYRSKNLFIKAKRGLGRSSRLSLIEDLLCATCESYPFYFILHLIYFKVQLFLELQSRTL